MMINQQQHPITFTHHKLMVTIVFMVIQSVRPQTVRPSCGSQEAYYANPEDCRSYYYCWNNENYLQYCPNGLYFHLAGRTCEPAGVADCGGYTGGNGVVTTNRPPGLFGSSLCTKICSETELAKKSPVKGVLYAICKCTESMTISSTIMPPSYAASAPLTTPSPPNVFSIISNFINSIFPGVR